MTQLVAGDCSLTDPCSATPQPERPRQARVWAAVRWTVRFIRNALAVIGLLFIVYHLGFDLSLVSSGSMAPTLKGDGQPGSDWMLTERVSYWFRNPRRWEVVQFVSDDQLVVAKRVVGLPDETIALRDHHTVIDQQLLPFPRSLAMLRYFPEGNLSGGRTAVCGNGYFLLGDDSRDSWDSRYEGPLARAAIRGRAWLIVWPLSRFGFVNDGRQ